MLAFTCFTTARRPIVHICGSSRPIFVDVSLGPTLLDVSLGPTLWSQLRRPRQLFADTSRANYLEPGPRPTPPPAPTIRRQVASNYLEPTLPPALHMWSHARHATALHLNGIRWRRRKRVAAAVVRWGQEQLTGGPSACAPGMGALFQKVQEVILFFKNVQKLKMQYQTCVFVNSIYFELSVQVQAADFDFGWA